MAENASLKFRKSFLGFRPGDVLDELGRMNREFEQKMAVQTRTISNLGEEIASLNQELSQAGEQLIEYQKQEQAIAQVLIKAQMKAMEIENRAHTEARRIVIEAEEEHKLKQKRLELLKEQYDQFRSEIGTLLQKYQILVIKSIDATGGDRLDTADSAAGAESEAAATEVNEENKLSLLSRFKPRIIASK